MPSAPTRTSYFSVRAVGEVEGHAGLVLVEGGDLPVDLQHAGRQRGEQPLVELGPQQADEAAAVGVDHVLREAHDGADLALGAAELGLARGAEVGDVDAHQAERLDGRRPQVEDVAGGAGLAVALDEGDLVAGLVQRQGGGHAGRSGAEDGDAAWA